MEALIPEEWFVRLSQAMLLVATVLSMVVLIKGADWLVDGASGLAYRVGMPKVIVGATIVALGTTSPECAVSVMAAWAGRPGLALGNAVGSIIADTGLILGVGFLMARLPADRYVLTRQGLVQLGSGVLLAGLCYASFAIWGDAASLGRPVGLGLLTLLAGYLYISIQWSRKHPRGEPFQGPKELTHIVPVKVPVVERFTHRFEAVRLFFMALVGLVLVLLASRVLVCSVTELAGRWGVPQVVIAATIVALGTSLPELVVGVTSIVKGHPEIIVGNIIGADILNVFFVVGASATAANLPVVENGQRIFLYLHLPAMIMLLVVFRAMIAMASREGLFSRWMGLPLVGLYLAYVALQFLFSS